MEELKINKNRNSTRKAYHNTWKNFNKFLIRLDTIPKSWEERIYLYCGYLIEIKGLQSSTIKSYVSGIKSVLYLDGYQVNDNIILLSSITKTCKRKNDIIKTRLPIQQKFLDLILFNIVRKYEDSQPYLEAMYVTAILFGYYGLMRIGELTESPHVMKAKNIYTCKRSQKILIILYSSKTHDQSSRPQKIRIEGTTKMTIQNNDYQYIAKTHSSTSFFCPFKWASVYLQLRRLRQDDFEQFFIFRDGSPLRSHHLRGIIRTSIHNLGLNCHLYDVHSLRIGRATDLQKLGYSVEHIKECGRWKSNAVYKYLRSW